MKNQIKYLVFVLALGASSGLWAQYGFGTNNPNPNAAVEIVSLDKGVLLPRLTLTASTTFISGATSTVSHTSMLVFNTNSSTLNGLRGSGFYFWTHSPTFGTHDGFWTQISNGPSLTDSATLHETLRWDGTNWVNSSALQNDDTNLTATGSLTVAGNIYADTFSTLWTASPPSPYAVNDVVLHEGRFYRNIDAATATSTTPSGTTLPNAATWKPISSAPQILSFANIGAGTATSTTATLTISEGNSLSLQASNGLHFNTAGTTNTLTLFATNELTGTVSTSDTGLVSETLNLTLANDTTAQDVFDLSSFEEVKAGTGTPSTQTFIPPAAAGDIYVDTASSTLWTYDGANWSLVETAVENIYTDDGSLTATRTVNLDGNWLQFTDTASSILYIDPTDDRIYIGDTITFSGTTSYTASLGVSDTADLDLIVEGDIKSRYIVDENNDIGKVGEVLTKTATGVDWKSSSVATNIQTLITTGTVSDGTNLLLIEPNNAAPVTVTLPTVGSGSFEVGYNLKIRRNAPDLIGTNDDVTLSGSIDGISSKPFNMGYQSVTLIATQNGWVTID